MIDSIKTNVRNFLRWSQRYTGTDNVYIARGGFWTTIQFGVHTVLSVATVVAFANLLPRETYGVYKYLLSLTGMFGFLTLTGVNTAVIRAVARGHDEVVPYAVRLQLRWNILAAAAIGSLAAYYGIRGNWIFSVSLVLLGISTPLVSVFNTYAAVLTGRKDFSRLAKMTVLSASVAAGAVVGGLFITTNVAALIAIYAISTAAPTYAAYRIVAAGLPNRQPDVNVINELRGTGFHLSAVGVLTTISMHFDKIVLFQVAGPAALAVYGFAIAGPDRLKGFVKNWVGITLPRLSERSTGEIRAVFYRRIGQSLVVGIVLAALYVLLAPLLFHWFLPQYLDAIRYSQAYALVLIFLPASVYCANILYSQNMLRSVYLYTIGTQVTRIGLYAFMGWRWQTWGLIAAVVVTTALSVILNILVWEIESRRVIQHAPQSH